MTDTIPVKEAILFLLLGIVIFTLKDISIKKFGDVINIFFLAFIFELIIVFILIFPDSISNLFTTAKFWEPTILKRVIFLLVSLIVLLINIILFLVYKSGIKI